MLTDLVEMTWKRLGLLACWDLGLGAVYALGYGIWHLLEKGRGEMALLACSLVFVGLVVFAVKR